MAALVAKKFDMVLTSLKINAEREAVLYFTAGIISPTAFLGNSITSKIELISF